MTFDVSQNLMKTMINELLNSIEQDADSSDVDEAASLEAIAANLDASDPEIPHDKRIRLLKQTQLCREFMAVGRAFDRALAAGDEALQDEYLRESYRLQKEVAAISHYLDFPFAAEALSKATGFAEFLALLPHVDCTMIYGIGYGGVARFPLIWAMSAREKPLVRVQLMLAAGARPDLASRMGETVLHDMAKMKSKSATRLPILRLLVFKGANLEARTLFGQTPLFFAIEYGSVENVSHFLTVGSKVSQEDMESATQYPQKLAIILEHLSKDAEALRNAAQLGGWLRGEIEACEQRAKAKAKDGVIGAGFQKQLEALRQSLAMLAALPGYKPVDTEQKLTWQAEPAAFWAVRHAETLAEYRHAIRRVDIKTFYDGNTHPIYWPLEAKTDRIERLWLMLSAGASVAGGEYETALHVFAQNRRKDAAEQSRIAQMLVQAGADLNALDYKARTPLTLAVWEDCTVEAIALLDLGASPDRRLSSHRLFGGEYEAPILFDAANNFRIFRHMLELGADVTACDGDGNTLSEFMEQELSRLTKMREQNRQENASSGILRRLDRSITNFSKSLKLLNKK